MPGIDLSRVPSYCAHEHWGSIAALGTFPGGFNADIMPGVQPSRRVGLLDLIIDPYFGGNLANAGLTTKYLADELQVANLFTLSSTGLHQAWPKLRTLIQAHLLTGTFTALRFGIRELYGVDILLASSQDIVNLDERIGMNYAGIFNWYRQAMNTYGLANLVRPVHPEFYLQEPVTPGELEETALMHTVLRIDPLLEFWKPASPRRDKLGQSLGVDPADAASWSRFITNLFDLACKRGAVGIKQLQAYSRSLDFAVWPDSQVRFRGDLTPSEVRVFQDWVVQACSAQAHERGWPQQVHVGTHNLGSSNPMPLLDLARRYPKMDIVQLHCWPFLREAGWLAKQVPNIHTDTCWLPILNPQYYREALQGWINYVPFDKICCSHDATSIEMAVGSLTLARRIAGEVLSEQYLSLELGAVESVLNTARALFHDNAAALYGHPEKQGVDA